MLQIENGYEAPKESNYYQNNNDHFQNPYNIQETTDYTEQELKGTSSTNNIYQNTSNKIQIPKKKLNNPTSFKKSKKERFSITRPRN